MEAGSHAPRSTKPHVLQYTSASCALRVRTCVLKAEPDAPRSPRDSSQRALRARNLTRGAHLWCTSSRPRARTAHIASRRLADENPHLYERNLMRRVPRGPMYSSRPKARTAHIGFVRLVHQNPRFSGAGPRLSCSRRTGGVGLWSGGGFSWRNVQWACTIPLWMP